MIAIIIFSQGIVTCRKKMFAENAKTPRGAFHGGVMNCGPGRGTWLRNIRGGAAGNLFLNNTLSLSFFIQDCALSWKVVTHILENVEMLPSMRLES